MLVSKRTNKALHLAIPTRHAGRVKRARSSETSSKKTQVFARLRHFARRALSGATSLAIPFEQPHYGSKPPTLISYPAKPKASSASVAP